MISKNIFISDIFNPVFAFFFITDHLFLPGYHTVLLRILIERNTFNRIIELLNNYDYKFCDSILNNFWGNYSSLISLKTNKGKIIKRNFIGIEINIKGKSLKNCIDKSTNYANKELNKLNTMLISINFKPDNMLNNIKEIYYV